MTASKTKVVKIDGTKVAETKKVDAKKAPATKKETAPAAIGRAAVLKELADLGWDGPTSYTATTLRDDLLPWVAAGKPADAANIPAGAMNHAHPQPKTAAARRLSKNYLAALADVLNAMDAGEDVREFVTTRLANGEVSA